MLKFTVYKEHRRMPLCSNAPQCLIAGNGCLFVCACKCFSVCACVCGCACACVHARGCMCFMCMCVYERVHLILRSAGFQTNERVIHRFLLRLLKMDNESLLITNYCCLSGHCVLILNPTHVLEYTNLHYSKYTR